MKATYKTIKFEIPVEMVDQAMATHPAEDGRGLVVDTAGEVFGIKNLTAWRTRKKDGITTGQLYHKGPCKPAEVCTATLEDGRACQIIMVEPKKKPVAPLVLPGRIENGGCGEYCKAGWVFNTPPEVWAFMLGTEDLKLAAQVMEAVGYPHPIRRENLRAVGVEWPDEPCRDYELPPGYVPFITPFPVPLPGDDKGTKWEKRKTWMEGGFDWNMKFRQWQKKLGWTGIAGACAAWWLYKRFDHPSYRFYVGPDELDALEV